jgi:ABC-type multidrug transport system fused ATPase/permease subunit
VASIAHDVLGAMPVVQAFNRERLEQQRFAQQNRRSIRAGVKATRLESKLYRIVSFASAVGICAVLFVGVRAVLAGKITAGDLLVFVSYLRSVNKPMRKTAKLAGQLAKSTACGQRIAELFALEPSIRNRPDARPIRALRGAIRFEDVGFEYEHGHPILEGISLSIEPGERVALVGHTGAGKTTLVKLLLRFYDPQHGTISVDGVDLRDLTLESLRQSIGWVHQDTILFGMTVRENIALGRAEASAELIRAAARCVHAADFIERLPKQYETTLGHGGCTLSGGQRQRIALARALLREPRILLLDEPATGLDQQTRRLVEEAWMTPENNASTIVICHRLHNMERFDRIIVLSGGRICGIGTHDELLATGGDYTELVRAGRDDGVQIADWGGVA